MSEIPSRELRNQTRQVLERVEAGESVTITVNGRPVAALEPIAGRRRWLPREKFLQTLEQADPALTSELATLAPESTDDLPFE